MSAAAPTRKHAKKILELLDYGLVSGVGSPEPGKMCVEALVCYALGEPHGDKPSCVGPAVRAFKIRLNDVNWPSNQARAEGLREIAIAQLGSNEIDQREFAGNHALRTRLRAAQSTAWVGDGRTRLRPQYRGDLLMSTKEPIDLSQFEGHTPGPWFVEYGYGRESGTVYEICAGTREVSTRLVETDAGVYHLDPRDAELMAAAPDLLAELRERRAKDAELNAARAVVAAARKLLGVGGSGNVAQLRAALAAHDALVDRQHTTV